MTPIVWLATLALLPAAHASATPAAGYGKGIGYCARYGSMSSAYSFDDVYACASTASRGPTPFDAFGTRSFQCVELAARFLWAVYGVWAGPETGVRDGADLVGDVHARLPSLRVGSAGDGEVPAAGDVMSFGPGGGSDRAFGHVAVVVSSDPDTGRVQIMSQNYPPGHAGEQSVRVDLDGGHKGEALLSGVWTRASWLELAAARAPLCVVPRLRHLTLREARRALRRAWCRLGGVHRTRPAPARRRARIVRQSARTGTQHRLHYQVAVTLD